MIVYFAQRRDGLVKIGAASTSKPDIEHRLGAYVRSKAGAGGRVLARTTGYLFVERWFHSRHALSRHDGEWFELSAKLGADIATLQRGLRLPHQPHEPPPRARLPGSFWRRVRLDFFHLDEAEMAAAMGTTLAAVVTSEYGGSTATKGAMLDGIAERAAVDFRWVRDGYQWSVPAPALEHRARYRTHIVRSIEARA